MWNKIKQQINTIKNRLQSTKPNKKPHVETLEKFKDETITLRYSTKPSLIHNLSQVENLWFKKLGQDHDRWLTLKQTTKLSFYYDWILENFAYQTMNLEDLVESKLLIESFTIKKGSLIDEKPLKTELKFSSNDGTWNLDELFPSKVNEVYTDWSQLRNLFYDLSYFKHNHIVHNLDPVTNITEQQIKEVIQQWFSPEFDVKFYDSGVVPFRLYKSNN